MDMKKPDLNEVREKIVDTAGLLLEKTALLKDAAQEKARILTQKAKIRAEVSRNGGRLERLYADLGSLYYCMKKDDPDEQMKQMCEEITVLFDRNEELERMLSELKRIEDPASEEDSEGDPDIPPEAPEEAPGEETPAVEQESEEVPGQPL